MANVLGLVTIVCSLIYESHFPVNGRGFSLRDGLSPFKVLALELKQFATLWRMVEIHFDGHYIDLQPDLAVDLDEIRRDMATIFQDVQDFVEQAKVADRQLLQKAHSKALFAVQNPQTILAQREEHWRNLFKKHRVIR